MHSCTPDLIPAENVRAPETHRRCFAYGNKSTGVATGLTNSSWSCYIGVVT